MKIEDEYVFNNGIYDIAIRSLKATFFDVLSFCDSLEYNNNQDFLDKINNLKNKMNDIIESVRDLDSYKENNNDNILKDNNINVDVKPINYSDKEEIQEQIDQNIVEEDEPKQEESNKIDDVNVSLISKVDNDNSIDIEKEETVNTDIEETDKSDNILTFKKYNDDIVKVILVSDGQYTKLNNSKESQRKLLDEINFFDEKVMEEKSSVNEKNSSENLTERAISLYKQGKTKEAQEIMDKINSMNHAN